MLLYKELCYYCPEFIVKSRFLLYIHLYQLWAPEYQYPCNKPGPMCYAQCSIALRFACKPEWCDFICELCCNPHYAYILETHETTNKVVHNLRVQNSSTAHRSFH